MIAELLLLYYEFFKIGLFAIGGGLATLPFLFDLADKYHWFTPQMVGDMIAISESTPGPIGINMATYVGFQNCGPIGAVVATLGIITPSIIIIIIIAKFLSKFSEEPIVKGVFSTLRPTVVGMIGAVALTLIISQIFNPVVSGQPFVITEFLRYKELGLFLVMLFIIKKFNKHPLFYIVISAAVGIVLRF